MKFDGACTDYKKSSLRELCEDEILNEFSEEFGKENICTNEAGLVTVDGQKVFEKLLTKVLHIAQDTEAPGQFCVVYECEDGAIWNRPYGMFVSEVDHVKYPNVKQKYRFELVKD